MRSHPFIDDMAVASDSEAIQTEASDATLGLDRFALLAMTRPDDERVWRASAS